MKEMLNENTLAIYVEGSHIVNQIHICPIGSLFYLFEEIFLIDWQKLCVFKIQLIVNVKWMESPINLSTKKVNSKI